MARAAVSKTKSVDDPETGHGDTKLFQLTNQVVTVSANGEIVK